MTDENRQEIIDSLDELLDREREALLAGQLDQIEILMTTKEQLIDRINKLPVEDRTPLEAIHQKVTRNQALLNSALEGIRAVADRMAELRRVRSGFETYDHRGKRQTFGSSVDSNLEKRA
ncbi:flagellar biosynthesis protein FlgN [Sedimentitalea sp. XS_ASV28]|uniref:flagellar biosynthesis protein FlgN n=1 Tax=Sedimentitalea sp. XS_ASV28 TaxID=3241296 RepID=UPI0035155C49